MTKRKQANELVAARLLERNAAIVERIKRGEKRYVLAMEYGLTEKTISAITIKTGLARWARFKRVVG